MRTSNFITILFVLVSLNFGAGCATTSSSSKPYWGMNPGLQTDGSYLLVKPAEQQNRNLAIRIATTEAQHELIKVRCDAQGGAITLSEVMRQKHDPNGETAVQVNGTVVCKNKEKYPLGSFLLSHSEVECDVTFNLISDKKEVSSTKSHCCGKNENGTIECLKD